MPTTLASVYPIGTLLTRNMFPHRASKDEGGKFLKVPPHHLHQSPKSFNQCDSKLTRGLMESRRGGMSQLNRELAMGMSRMLKMALSWYVYCS